MSDIAGALDFYFNDPKDFSTELLKSAKVTGDAFNALLELKKKFIEIEWTQDEIEKTIRDYIEQKGYKLKMIVQPLRLVISGTLATPGIFDSLYYVGKEATIRRIEHFLTNYRAPG